MKREVMEEERVVKKDADVAGVLNVVNSDRPGVILADEIVDSPNWFAISMD